MFWETNRSAGNQGPRAAGSWGGDQNWLQKHHRCNTLMLRTLGQVTDKGDALAYEAEVVLERFGGSLEIRSIELAVLVNFLKSFLKPKKVLGYSTQFKAFYES